MDGEALRQGGKAFGAGLSRTRNPYDPSSEEWMCWRDGWEQAKAASDAASNAVPEQRTG